MRVTLGEARKRIVRYAYDYLIVNKGNVLDQPGKHVKIM